MKKISSAEVDEYLELAGLGPIAEPALRHVLKRIGREGRAELRAAVEARRRAVEAKLAKVKRAKGGARPG